MTEPIPSRCRLMGRMNDGAAFQKIHAGTVWHGQPEYRSFVRGTLSGVFLWDFFHRIFCFFVSGGVGGGIVSSSFQRPVQPSAGGTGIPQVGSPGKCLVAIAPHHVAGTPGVPIFYLSPLQTGSAGAQRQRKNRDHLQRLPESFCPENLRMFQQKNAVWPRSFFLCWDKRRKVRRYCKGKKTLPRPGECDTIGTVM